MPITIVGVNSGVSGGGPSSTADNISVSIPAGTTVGDLVIAILCCSPSAATNGPGTTNTFFVTGLGNRTWTVIDRASRSGQCAVQMHYWPFETGATAVAINNGVGQFGGVGALITVRGHSSSSPVSATKNANDTGINPSLDSMTIPSPGGVGIIAVAAKQSGGFTPPTNWTERFDTNKGTQVYGEAATRIYSSSGSTGILDWSESRTNWAAVGAIIREPVGGPVIVAQLYGR